jgi:hypothetical protein
MKATSNEIRELLKLESFGQSPRAIINYLNKQGKDTPSPQRITEITRFRSLDKLLVALKIVKGGVKDKKPEDRIEVNANFLKSVLDGDITYIVRPILSHRI